MGNDASDYTLNIKDYNSDISTVGDSLYYHDGMKFSAPDRDNDILALTDCTD